MAVIFSKNIILDSTNISSLKMLHIYIYVTCMFLNMWLIIVYML